jgi:hypothetical protein
MKYVPLLTLKITHPYYPGGQCADFDIAPTEETTRLLTKQRCVPRALRDGIRVLIMVDDCNNPLIAYPEPLSLHFTMRLRNADFALFTDSSALPSPLLFISDEPTQRGEAAGSPIVLKPSAKRVMVTERFQIPKGAKDLQLTLGGKPAAGLKARDFALNGLRRTTKAKKYDAAAKIITVNASSVALNSVINVAYETTPPHDPGVYAEIVLQHGSNQQYDVQHEARYEVVFVSKKTVWRYYIVTDNAGGEFNINDTAPNPIPFKAAAHLNAETDSSLSADPVAAALARKYPDQQRYRIESGVPIPFQQRPPTTLQLLLNGAPLIKPLVSPTLSNTVSISREDGGGGTSKNEVALYHIIQHFI